MSKVNTKVNTKLVGECEFVYTPTHTMLHRRLITMLDYLPELPDDRRQHDTIRNVLRYCAVRKSIDGQGSLVDCAVRAIPNSPDRFAAVVVYQPFVYGGKVPGGDYSARFDGACRGRGLALPENSPHAHLAETVRQFGTGGWPFVCQLARNYGANSTVRNAVAVGLFTTGPTGEPTLVGVGYDDNRVLGLAKGKAWSNKLLNTTFTLTKAWRTGSPSNASRS